MMLESQQKKVVRRLEDAENIMERWAGKRTGRQVAGNMMEGDWLGGWKTLET